MCGLNFIIDKTGKCDERVIQAMNMATMHRGPDHTSSLIRQKYDLRFLLGVNRLRITDNSSGSDQPFSLHPEYFLLFNGELYNHAEIRNTLMHKGIQFKTASDTETLYYFLIEYEKEELHKLNGMFSFVFVDLMRDEVTIARDEWGMKPIYYYQDEHLMILSSEIQGILASGYVNKAFNNKEIPHYLHYKYTSPGNTFYQNIFQLKKGCYQTYDIISGKLSENSYKETAKQEYMDRNKSVMVNEVEQLILESIETHTKASVPVGLFLSGGIDSTLLLAISCAHQIYFPYCFTISNKPSEKQYGTVDYWYSRLAANQFKCDALNVEIGAEILEHLDEWIRLTDHPVADGAALLTYLLSKEAKKKVGVVLSGAGGDELFAGYNRHQAFYTYLRYRRLFERSKQISSYMKPLTNFGSFPVLRKKRRLANKFIDGIAQNPETTFHNFTGLYNLGNYQHQESWPDYKESEGIIMNFTCALEDDRNKYLPEDVLTINDRMTMLSGLEMRMPYLDAALVKYMNGVKPVSLIKYGQKWILKEILKKYTGNTYINRAKEGFGFPFGLWIKHPGHRHLLDKIINDKNPLLAWIDKRKVEEIILAHLSDKADYSQEIWALLSLTSWIHKHF
jgi:asparagine synthase (glutamine-hydrolysing)